MNNSFYSILKDAENILQGQNGELKGGYLSLTNGQYRIVITRDNPSPQYLVTNSARICWNDKNCGGSTNSHTCYNTYTNCGTNIATNNSVNSATY